VQTQYTGHDVVDPEHRMIGTIDDVIHDDAGNPEWAIVDLGWLRSSRYVPIAAGYVAETGELVVPYDKQTVKTAPKVDRNHVLDPVVAHSLRKHYELSDELSP
jgi:hypothetical protein